MECNADTKRYAMCSIDRGNYHKNACNIFKVHLQYLQNVHTDDNNSSEDDCGDDDTDNHNDAVMQMTKTTTTKKNNYDDVTGVWMRTGVCGIYGLGAASCSLRVTCSPYWPWTSAVTGMFSCLFHLQSIL